MNLIVRNTGEDTKALSFLHQLLCFLMLPAIFSFFSAIILCTATNLQSHEAKSQTDMESSCSRNNWDPLDDTHMEETTQAASSTAKPEAEETASRETGPTPTQETKRNHETWQDIASCQTPFDTAHEIHEIA